MRTTALAFALLFVAHTARADEAKVPPQPKVDDLIAKAKAAGKPLVIDFYAVWCKPCKKFKNETLPKKDVQAALTSVVFQQYDAERDNGLKAAMRYKVRGYPTFVVIDGSGKARTARSGFMDEEQFLGFVTQAQVDVLDQASVNKLLAKSANDARVVLAVARWYRAAGKWKQADRTYQRVVKLDTGNKRGLAGEAAWECLQLQRYHKARAWVVRTNVSFVRRFPASRKALAAFSQIALDLSAATRDAIAAKILSGLMNDDARLNGAVYEFLAAGSYDAALKAAERQVALKPKEANGYDTLAEVHHYRGERDKAIAASKKALELIGKKPQRAMFAKNLARFEKPGRAPSSDVEREVYQAKKFLADLPGHDPVAQKVDKPADSSGSPQLQRFLAFSRGVRTSYRDVSKACARHAGKLEEVYVRVEFADQKSKRAKKVVVLEPYAPRRLKRCLVKNLTKVAYNERPKSYEKRYTSAVRFERKAAKPQKKPVRRARTKKTK